MTREMSYAWHLRARMAEQGLFQTSELVPLLAERGVHLSREQVYRLVTQPPQRLSLDTLAALCDILEATPNDLIEITATPAQAPTSPRHGARRSAGRRDCDGNPRRARRPGARRCETGQGQLWGGAARPDRAQEPGRAR